MNSSAHHVPTRIGCIGIKGGRYLFFDRALLLAKDEASLRQWCAHLGIAIPDAFESLDEEESLDLLFGELWSLLLDLEAFSRFSRRIIDYCEHSMRPEITSSEMGVLIEPVLEEVP